VEHIHAHDHCRGLHERQVVNSPRDSTDFGVHLDQDLGNDRPQIFALRDGAVENNLRWDGILFEQELFAVVIEGASCLGTSQNQDDHLDSIVQLLLELFLPGVELHGRFDLDHVGLRAVVTTSLQAFSHG